MYSGEEAREVIIQKGEVILGLGRTLTWESGVLISTFLSCKMGQYCSPCRLLKDKKSCKVPETLPRARGLWLPPGHHPSPESLCLPFRIPVRFPHQKVTGSEDRCRPCTSLLCPGSRGPPRGSGSRRPRTRCAGSLPPDRGPRSGVSGPRAPPRGHPGSCSRSARLGGAALSPMLLRGGLTPGASGHLPSRATPRWCQRGR